MIGYLIVRQFKNGSVRILGFRHLKQDAINELQRFEREFGISLVLLQCKVYNKGKITN